MKPFPSGIRTAVSALVLALAFAGAGARQAEDYLHGGAAKYIQSRLQEASVEVDEGLRQFPHDSRLRILAAQLKSLKDQKKQDQNGSGTQENQDPKSKENKKDSTDQDAKQKKDQAQKDKEKQDKEEKKEQQDQAKEKQDQLDSSGQAPAPVKPGEMSKEEAERLLNSYQDDEKREHQQMQKRQRRPVETEKDW